MPRSNYEGMPEAPVSRSTAIERYLASLHRRFSEYNVSLEEVRKLLEEDLGKRTLTEELYKRFGDCEYGLKK